jgi:hypothetical protein
MHNKVIPLFQNRFRQDFIRLFGFVLYHVVANKEDSGIRKSTQQGTDGPKLGRPERDPPRYDHQLGIYASDPQKHAEPGDRIKGVKDILNTFFTNGGFAAVFVRLSRKQPLRILSLKGEEMKLMPF